MEEILEVIETADEFGLSGVVSWVLRVIGFLLLVAGLALWLLTDSGLLVLPAVLIVIGVVMMIATEVLFALADIV